MLGVVNEFPVNNREPPVEASYQFIFPAEAVAAKVTVPDPQTDEGEVELTVGELFTVAVIAVRVGLLHPFTITVT